MEPIQIREGMDVVGTDGEKLGDVDHQEGDFIVVKKGFFFPKDYYIPVDAIASADEDRVYLTVTKDAALDQGWDIAPQDRTAVANGDYVADETVARPGNAIFDNSDIGDTAVDTTATTGGLATDETYATTDTGVSNTAYARTGDLRDRATTTDADTVRVPLSEEELTATTRNVDRGAVRVEKGVIEEEQQLDVPVTEEQVHVERRTVDRDVAPGETVFEEGTIEVPVRGEEVDVEKRTRVTGEVDISKTATEQTRHVRDTVRREEAHVEDESGNVIEDTARRTPKDRPL